MTRHRGYSLIELLTAISAGTAVMAIAVGLLGSLLDLDRHARERAQQRSALDRLADQFRRDVHAAVRVKPLETSGRDSPPGWQFQLDSRQSIEYRSAAGGDLGRTERTGAEVRRRESYRLPPQTMAAIQFDERVEPRVVGLRLIAKDGSTVKPIRGALRIVATLGTDHRFLGRKGS